jgi:hypothetical protein
MAVKFPEVSVKLVGEDGNAFAILGRVKKALRRAKVDKDQIEAYFKDAMSGDYNHLLRVTMETVSCDTEDEEAVYDEDEEY